MSNNDLVIIELDRPRVLFFGHTALKTLAELTGKSLEDIEGDMNQQANFELIEKLAYCALLKDARDNSETLTIEKVAGLLDEAPNFIYTLEKLMRAWRSAFGIKEQEEGNQPPAGQPAKGKDSTGKKVSA